MRNNLGFSRVRVAYTAGEAIGPDLFTFYRSIGINLKQLYGSTETAVFVCLQPDDQAKADTVGIPISGVEIKVADNGEILVRSPGLLKEYYKNPTATAEVLTADGWYHTSDAGFLDAQGHLKIIDRVKDVGRISGGANDGAMFAPKYVENKLKFFPYIKEAVAYGDGRERVCVMVNIDFDAVGNWAERRNLPYAGYTDLAQKPEVYELIKDCVEKVNADLAADDHAGGLADQPLPDPAQGTGRRRRRAHPHQQGPPRLHRREVPCAGRSAVWRQDRAVHRDPGQVRGWPHRQRQRHLAHRGHPTLRTSEGRSMSSVTLRTEPVEGVSDELAARLVEQTSANQPIAPARKSGEVILNVENISLAFGGVKALSDISFDVREHEIRAIIGPNGAGKSSMLNCINGVYQPQQGSITFRGKTFKHMNSHQVAEMGVARTFQNLALFKGMSVLDNIMTGRNLRIKSNLFLQALRIGPAEREEIRHREFVEHIIDFLEIQPYRKTPVGQLPYGLQKRVDLGRALAMEPQVLLLDEPMAGMNVEEKQDMCRFVLDVNDEFGTTVVLIEHDMGVVMDISDRVVVLDYGKKIGDGTPDEVRNNPEVIKAYLGT